MSEKKEEYELFGNYLILDHLVDGGMAKICRAFQLTEQESRIVAIKMVQPQFSKDESFKQMFDDEVRLTYQLQHPNIVQIIDSGMTNEQLFVSMEYCDGRNLKEYLDKIKVLKEGEFKGFFPSPVAAHVVADVCFALQYAHNFTDKLTGQKANIIHRDISPHNIMLNYDGTVKVIDFGIAKSEKNSEATQAGTIKGKLSYLAPEYLEGQELDHRYDQFAVGITLWELLTGQKLFKAANDLAVLKKIQECKIVPPSKINPTVPKELDLIVLKALQKNREKRFKDMQDFGDTLKVFLYKKYPKFSTKQVIKVINTVFKEDIQKDREKLFRFGKIDTSQYLEMIRQGKGNSFAASSSSDEDKKKRAKEVELDFGFDEEDETKTTTKAAVSSALRSGKTGTLKNINLGKKGSITKAKPATKTEPAAEATGLETSKSTKKARTAGKTKTNVSINKKPAKKGGTRTAIRKTKKKNSLAPVAAAVVVAIAGFAGYKFFMKPKANVEQVVVRPTEKKPNPAREPSSSASAKMAKVIIADVNRNKVKVFVNGKRAKIDFLNQIEVPMNKEVAIRVEVPYKEHYVYKGSFTSAANNEIKVRKMPYAHYGYLVTSRACYHGKLRFELFGEERVEKLPIDRARKFGIRLNTDIDEMGKPVPKEHTLYYSKIGDSVEKKVVVTIEDGVSIDLCKELYK